MTSEVEDVSPTSPVEESDADTLLSLPHDLEPNPGLNGTPVRCE